MNQLQAVWRRFAFFLHKEEQEAEMAAEIQSHLDGLIERHIAAGMTAEEARYAASRQFGGVEQVKEAARDQRSLAWLTELFQDLQYAGRHLRKNPGFSAVIVLTLALGIGACAAMFSVINTAVLHPLPFPHPERLVAVHETFLPENQRSYVSPRTFVEFRQHTAVFADLAACYFRAHNLTGAGDSVRVFTQHLTVNYFSMLGVQPALGRDFRAEDGAPAAPFVVILSHRLWQEYFGGRPDAIGQGLAIDGRPATIIGVMPADFQAESTGPLMYAPVTMPVDIRRNNEPFLTVRGRLQPDITLERAATDIDPVARRIGVKYPHTNSGWGGTVTSLVEETVAFARPLLFTLFVAVGFLLLIACVNIANLLLARATSRQKEIALRTALGAGRGRIVRQLLSESLLLAVLGGVLGVFLANGNIRLMRSFAPFDLPRVAEIAVDGPALVFSGLLAVAAGLGFGLVPAIHATRVDLNQMLKAGGRGLGDGPPRSRLRHFLVVAEVALALVVLVGAGLLVKSGVGMLNVDRGYEPKGLYLASIALTQQKYSTAQGQCAYVDHVLEHVSRVPGVAGASLAAGSLMFTGKMNFTIADQPPGSAADRPQIALASVTREFLATVGIPLLRGRGFTAQDTGESPPVILINQELARQYFPDRDPIGQSIHVFTQDDSPVIWRKIVGVVANIRATDAYDAVLPQVFVPFTQMPYNDLVLGVRLAPNSPIDLRAISDAIHAVDKDVPISIPVEATQSASRGLPAVRRFSMAVSAVFASIALLFAAIGIYGVMAYNVAQRTGEIGIRMALGAQRVDVLRMILLGGGRLVGVGLILGLAGAIATAHLLAGQLYNLSPYDPYVFSGTSALLIAAAFVACSLPAWHATKVDPAIALRCE